MIINNNIKSITFTKSDGSWYKIDMNTSRVSFSYKDNSISLTESQLKLVLFLAQREDYTATVDSILEEFNSDDTNILDTLVCNLRKQTNKSIIDTSRRKLKILGDSSVKLEIEHQQTSPSSAVVSSSPSSTVNTADSSDLRLFYTGDYYIYYLKSRDSDSDEIAVGMMQLDCFSKRVTYIASGSKNPDYESLRNLLSNPNQLNADSNDYRDIRAFSGDLNEELLTFSCTLSETSNNTYRKYIVFPKIPYKPRASNLTSALIAVLTTSHNASSAPSFTFWVSSRTELDLNNEEVCKKIRSYLNQVPLELRKNIFQKDTDLYFDIRPNSNS